MTQPNLAEQVTALAMRSYEDAVARLKANPSGRIVGTVVSPSFEGLEEEDRQEQFYQLVEDELGVDARRNLLLIFTNTPEEDAIFERNAEEDKWPTPRPDDERAPRR